MAGKIDEKKKTIIYLHRYPIEYENNIYPATRKIFDLLLKKYNIVYISFKTAGKIDEKLRRGLMIRELAQTIDIKNSRDKWIKTISWFAQINKIKRIINEFKPSVIVHKEQLPFLPYLFSRMKIPLILDIGDWWWTTLIGGNKLGLKIAESVENFEMKTLGKRENVYLVAHSNTEAKILSQRGIKVERIRVINHPSSNEIYRPIDASKLRNKLGLKDNFIVAVHGIIHPSKGYGQILRWWSEISKSKKNWKLLIIGGTIGEKWCRREIRKLKIENSTIMTGWLNSVEELNEYLNVADCLLVTRRNDLANQGLIPSSLFHSLSIGKPLLVTGLPGLSEMIRDGIDGYTFEPDNMNSFFEKLDYISNHKKEAERIGKAGTKRGKEIFNPDKCANGFYNFIDKISNEN